MPHYDGRGIDAGFIALLAAETYRAGISPPSFDKQFVRDYLETLDWNKQAPGPMLPSDVIDKTAREISRRPAAVDVVGRVTPAIYLAPELVPRKVAMLV